MNKVVNGLLLMLFCIFVASCSPKWTPKKYRLVEITDTGEIYSTLNLEKRNDAGKSIYRKMLIQKRWMPDSLFRTISGLANENKWPVGIKTAQQRFDNRLKMRQIKAYTTSVKFKGKYILYVPASENNRENKDLAAEFQTEKDYYMIIGKGGVTKKDEWLKGYENWKRPPRVKVKDVEPAGKPPVPSAIPKNPRTPQTVPPTSTQDNSKDSDGK